MDMKEETKEHEDPAILILMFYTALSFETAQRWERDWRGSNTRSKEKQDLPAAAGFDPCSHV